MTPTGLILADAVSVVANLGYPTYPRRAPRRSDGEITTPDPVYLIVHALDAAPDMRLATIQTASAYWTGTIQVTAVAVDPDACDHAIELAAGQLLVGEWPTPTDYVLVERRAGTLMPATPEGGWWNAHARVTLVTGRLHPGQAAPAPAP